MLLPRGLGVLTIQVCVFCLASFAKPGEAGRGGSKEEEEATGEWGQWGEWSTCSAECSTGIIVRSRQCQHPHMLPVAYLLSKGDDSVHCPGSDKEIKLCNKQPCANGRGGWREEECAKYDASVHGGQRYTWEPFIHPSDPCKLTCRAKGHHFYSNLANRVVDGTPCAGATTNPSAVCLQGQCKEVGCDDLVGSRWRPDVCGVCKGDNSTCRKISGIFTRQDLKRGMNQIVVIPVGSTRIRIKGLRYSSNWLALQTSDRDYVLNGGQKRSAARDLEAAGTVFMYKTKRRCSGQCLVAKGPTQEALNLVLNTRGRNRGVMYSFNIPVNASDRYFRRIIDSARPRADLVTNVTSPQLPQRFRNTRHFRRRGHAQGKSADSSSDNKGSSSTTTTTTTTSTTTTASTTTTTPTTTTTTTTTSVPTTTTTNPTTTTTVSNNYNNNNDQTETTAESTDEDEEWDDLDDDDLNDGIAAEDSPEEDESPEEWVEGGEAPSLDHSVNQEEDVPEDRADDEGHPKITRKERPRFIDPRIPTQEPFDNQARTFELQSNTRVAESSRESGVPPDDSQTDPSRHQVGPEPENEGVDAGAPPSIDDEADRSEAAEPDPPPDRYADVSDGPSDPRLLQNDSPRQQYLAAYRARASDRHNSRQRSWRRFRRPNYSQSFTFRGRHRPVPEDPDDDRTPGSPQQRALHITGGQRFVRYRQPPQNQGSQRGRPISTSAYGQGSNRRGSYSSSSAYARRRQHPSQRQALRAGQSVSQDQDGDVQLLTVDSNQRPQRGNVDPTQDADARRLARPGEGDAEQGRTPAPLDDYQRQLLRRRQLIEQRIAAQNAEYQRRLEERNQRLRQQHLERQQRLRPQDVGQVNRPGVHNAQASDRQDRQNLVQERNSARPPGSSLSGGFQGSPDDTRADTPTRQPERSSSGHRPGHSQLTPPFSPNSLDGNSEAVDGRRPLIISNRRPNVHRKLPPSSHSPSEESPRRPGHAESVAAAGQSLSNVLPQRPGLPTLSSSLHAAENNLEAVDRQQPPIIPNKGQQPPIISNRRQQPPISNNGQPAVISNTRQQPPIDPNNRQPPPIISNNGQQPPITSNGRQQPPIISNRREPTPVISNNRQQPTIISNTRQQPPIGPNNRQQPPIISNNGQQPPIISNNRQQPPVIPNTRQQPPIITNNGQQPPIITNDRQQPPIITNQRQSFQQRQSFSSSAAAGPVANPARPSDNAASAGQAERADRGWPMLISNRRQDPASPPGALASGPAISAPEADPQGGLPPTGTGPESGYGPPQVHGPLQSPGHDSARQPVNPSPPGISPHLASLGGGFVAPQYIPENTRSYHGQSFPLPNQLPSGGDESQLVIGGPGNVIPNGAESSPPVGGEGGLLAIEEDNSVYEWRVSGLSECTLTCGGGFQQTVVVCLDTRTQAYVTDDNCQHVQRPETKALSCSTWPCPASWQPSQWSQCSVSCGPGEQTRLVQCFARISPTLNVTMADENCQSAEKPASRQQCQTAACNTWKVGNWSKCSVQCGEGVKTRDVYCTDQTGYDVDDDLCSASGSKPSREEVCVMDPCSKGKERGKGWYYTHWPQQCPVRCGSGTMERHVTCLGEGGAPIPESSCNVASRPQGHQECSADSPCGGQWFTGEWTQCNVTCGSGHQEREVICMKGLSGGLLSMVGAENCATDEKPTSLQLCQMDPCVPKWYMTSWTECSQSCGTGHRTREVKCLDPQQRPSSQCPQADKPGSREACNTASCVTTPPPAPAQAQCRDTFSRCQLVKHARMCRFGFYRKKCCATCALDT